MKDKKERKKWKELSLKIRVTFILLIIFGVLYGYSAIFHSKAPVIYGAALLFMITDLIILYIFKRKEEIRNYSIDLAWYRKRLDIFRNLLKEDSFRFYDKKKIQFLIDRCNDEIPKLRLSSTLFKPMITVFSGMIIPIIIYGFTMYSQHLGNEVIAYILVFTVILIMYILGFYYMIKPTIEKILDSKYYTITNIKNMLQDILLVDFTNENRE